MENMYKSFSYKDQDFGMEVEFNTRRQESPSDSRIWHTVTTISMAENTLFSSEFLYKDEVEEKDLITRIRLHQSRVYFVTDQVKKEKIDIQKELLNIGFTDG